MNWKKMCLTIGVLLSVLCLGWASGPVKKPVNNKLFVLGNGLKVFLEEKTGIPLLHIGFGVNVGSKNETDESSGLVHLLEHLILLGSSNTYSREELVEKVRQSGLFFNAHTSHDLMTFAMSVPSANTDAALDILREKVFNLKLTTEELEKEKKVILEELSQEGDDPVKLSIRLALGALFAGHPYARPVGGEKSILRDARAETLDGFYKKYFVPSNCSIAVVGDFQVDAMEKKIKEIFGKVEITAAVPQDFKTVPPMKKNVEIRRELDINQAHLVVGFIAPGTNHPDKLAMDLMNQVLGGGVNPLLFRPLGGRRRLVESIKIRYITLTYGGAFLIHLVLDARKINSARSKLTAFLKGLRSFKFSKQDHMDRTSPWITDYLVTAKTWMHLAYERFREQGLNMALSYARYMLTHNTDEEDQRTYKERLDAVTSTDLQNAAYKYLGGRRYVKVVIVPKKNKGKK